MLVKHMIRELMKCPEDMEVYTCQDHDRDLSDLSIHYINNTFRIIIWNNKAVIQDVLSGDDNDGSEDNPGFWETYLNTHDTPFPMIK